MLLNLLKNNVSKSLLYILFFAGILKLGGMILTWFWNAHLVENFGLEYITFLESVGMLAFFYLVYSGIKFGFNTISSQNIKTDKLTNGNMPECQDCDKNSTNKNLQRLNNLTADEKERLKEAIAKCCGMNQIPTKIEINQKLNIQPHHKTHKN